MTVAILVVVEVAGCGRVGFDAAARDGSGDGNGDGTLVDGAAPDALGAFTDVQLIAGVDSSQANDDPFISRDGSELYFASDATGSGDVYVALRNGSGQFDNPTLVFSTTASEGYPALSLDGLAIWFSRNDSIYVATRPTTSTAWSVPMLAGIDGPGSADKPGGTFDDDLQMIFESITGSDRDLYVARRASKTAPWSAIVPLDNINTTATEGHPYVSPDGRTLYFYSDRDGNEDIWMATRASTSDPFGTARRVDELATAANERDPALTTDERTIIFSRNFDLYIATR